MRSDPRRRRGGFTAIELLIVLVVVLILIGMAVPALVGAMRKGSVNDAANSIVRISSQARQFARTRQAPRTGAPQAYFGLVLVADEQPSYVALTWGTTSGKADIFYQKEWDPTDDRTDFATYTSRSNRMDSSGKPIPVAKLLFNRNVVIYAGSKHDPADTSNNTPLETQSPKELGWFYQYRTGYPITTASATAKPVNVGVDPDYPPPAAGGATGLDPAAFPNALRHLTLRTADGRYNTAIAIYQIGLSNVQDY